MFISISPRVNLTSCKIIFFTSRGKNSQKSHAKKAHSINKVTLYESPKNLYGAHDWSLSSAPNWILSSRNMMCCTVASNGLVNLMNILHTADETRKSGIDPDSKTQYRRHRKSKTVTIAAHKKL